MIFTLFMQCHQRTRFAFLFFCSMLSFTFLFFFVGTNMILLFVLGLLGVFLVCMWEHECFQVGVILVGFSIYASFSILVFFSFLFLILVSEHDDGTMHPMMKNMTPFFLFYFFEIILINITNKTIFWIGC